MVLAMGCPTVGLICVVVDAALAAIRTEVVTKVVIEVVTTVDSRCRGGGGVAARTSHFRF
jgi:hypothetical protein